MATQNEIRAHFIIDIMYNFSKLHHLYAVEAFTKLAIVFSTYLQYKYFENSMGKGEIARYGANFSDRVENAVGKGEIARYEQFFLFPQRFLPYQRSLHHFHQIENCRFQTL